MGAYFSPACFLNDFYHCFLKEEKAIEKLTFSPSCK